MSKIWEALRQAERLKNGRACKEVPDNCRDAILDRRSTQRFLANTPVLVYGYGATDDPFHERTEALSVNGSGGLITLTTPVNPGQTLLLTNELNLKEETCTVVRQVSTRLNRTEIVVAGGVEDGAGLGRSGDFARPVISARIFAVMDLLTAQAESLMRHCASVSWQPQVQDSALKR